MNADGLLALYDRVADAPNAVGCLRRFVLDLAVRGKLVEQDPADESASELLERIAVDRARVVKAREIKAKKPLPENTHETMSMNLPDGWSSARLADITICLDYMRRPINATERAKRIEGKSHDELFPYYGATKQQGWIDDYLFDEELVLLGEDGVPFHDPYRPKAYIISGKTWVNNHAHVFRGILISHAYLAHALNVFDYSGRVVGATRAKLNQTRALGIPIPLPPLPEQHRIVAKVDKLLALCDRVEEVHVVRTETRARLTKASFARVTAPDANGSTSQAHARFAINTLPLLTAQADQVKHLRQMILSLAVHGKLVNQDPTDEPASELLSRITAGMVPLVEAGTLRRRKLPPSRHEPPFSLPGNWQWARIRQVFGDRGQRVPDRQFTYVDVSAIDRKAGLVADPRVLDADQAPSRARKVARRGDVVYSCVRPYLLNVAIIEDDFDPPPIVSTAFEVLTGYDLVLPRYTWIVLRAPFMITCVEQSQRGQAYPAINSTDFAVLPFPLPPLAEQGRIVARVDELMALCDRLEDGLSVAADTRGQLLDSLLQESLTFHDTN